MVEQDIQSQQDVPSASSTLVPTLSPEISNMSSSQESRGNNFTQLEHCSVAVGLVGHLPAMALRNMI